MRKSSLALAITVGVLAQQAGAAGFIEDTKASISSRTMYFSNDQREGGADQREWGTALRADLVSGFTQGFVGFGLDVQGVAASSLGDDAHHPTNNTFFPSKGAAGTDAADPYSTGGATAKMRISKTEFRYGNTLAPNLPILVSNDARLTPQVFSGGMITSREIQGVTFTAGELEHQRGRASSNYSGMGVAGGTAETNKFRFAGADWKVTKDLTLQYYYANLEDYYRQNFLGLLHVLPIGDDQSFKTDLRYFNSQADGKNSSGDSQYRFRNGGYYKNGGEVDNNTWSTMFTYTLGGHSLMLGRQQVSDSGGMVYMNSGSLADERGAGGVSFYLFTDSLVSGFNRAGENTTFGQYAYDFARLGVPGLRASVAYLYGNNARTTSGVGDRQHEQETDMRVDYVVQSGPLKGFGTTLRHGIYNGNLTTNGTTRVQDANQTRLIFNYTYNFF